jgi:hypothetical protein
MTTNATFRRLLGIGWMLFWSAPATAADVEALKASTVRITVEHGVGEIETGAGIILCQSGGRVDVLTAKHVVSGVGLVDAYGAPTGRPFGDVRKVEVAFYRNLLRPMLVAPHDVLKAEHDDLAILILRGVEERLRTAAIGASDTIAATQEVQSVGHHSALRDGDWWWTDGKVRQTGRFLLHSAGFGSAGVAGGFSGGPLYNRAGEVVGINVQRLDDDGQPGQRSGARRRRATPSGDADPWFLDRRDRGHSGAVRGVRQGDGFQDGS